MRITAGAIAAVILIMAFWTGPSAGAEPNGLMEPIRLIEPGLTESSGLAFSHRMHGAFWSHNDSGGLPEIFAFDAAGKSLARGPIAAIKRAVDWEDMASFMDGDVPRLLVADSGDNQANRKLIWIYLFDEPDPTGSPTKIHVQTLRVTYPDGPRDCEAVAVDIERRVIVMVTKSALPFSGVYTIGLPDRDLSSSTIDVIATRITTLPIPMVTAADIDPKTGDLWLANYFQAYRYSRLEKTQPLVNQLAGNPTAVDLPKLRQVEALAVDQQGDVWITTEGKPTLMQKIENEK